MAIKIFCDLCGEEIEKPNKCQFQFFYHPECLEKAREFLKDKKEGL